MQNKQPLKLYLALLAALTLSACNGGSNTASSNTASTSPLQSYINSLAYTPQDTKQLTGAGTNQQSFSTPGGLTINSVDIKFYAGVNCTGANVFVNTLNGSEANPVIPAAGTYTSTNASNNALCSNYVNVSTGSANCGGLYDDMTNANMRSVQYTYNLNDGNGGSYPVVAGCMYNPSAQVGETIGTEGLEDWASATSSTACVTGACGYSQPYSSNITPPEPLVTITPTPDPVGEVMMGNAYTFTASFSGMGATTVSAAFTNPATGVITSNPETCALSSAGATSCTFTVVTTWDTSLANSLSLAYTIDISATNSVPVTGNPLAYTQLTPTVYLPQTGQTPTAPEVATAGMDGYSYTGIAWAYVSSGSTTPNPRFTVGTGDQANCVTDNLTGLMWVRNPNSINGGIWSNWQNAVFVIENQVNVGAGICGYTDWSLPTINALNSLVNYSLTGSLADWLTTQGFQSVPGNMYWSSTASANDSNLHYRTDFNSSFTELVPQQSTQSAIWPVRQIVQ